MGENKEPVFSSLNNKKLGVKRERRNMSGRIKKHIFVRNLFILFITALVTLAVKIGRAHV